MSSPRYLTDPAYRARVDASVAAAPPLTSEQRDQLRAAIHQPAPLQPHQRPKAS